MTTKDLDKAKKSAKRLSNICQEDWLVWEDPTDPGTYHWNSADCLGNTETNPGYPIRIICAFRYGDE